MSELTKVTVYYNDKAVGGTSDKQYSLFIEKEGSGYVVNYANGPRGGTQQYGTKTAEPVSLQEAKATLQEVLTQKLRKGYTSELTGQKASEPVSAPVMPARSAGTGTEFPVELLEEISQSTAAILLKDPRYLMQVKHDGRRQQLEQFSDKTITSYNRRGLPIPTPRNIVTELQDLSLKSALLDGELVGATFYAFDILKLNGVNLSKHRYEDRFKTLKQVLIGQFKRNGVFIRLCPTWDTTKEKQLGLAALKENNAEGAVFKLKDAPYSAGRNGSHKKLKFIKSVTAKVIRVGEKGHDSATVAVIDGKKWREIGRASLIGKDRRIKVGSIVELNFLYFTGSRIYQPRIMRLREDQTEADCTFAQLASAYKEGIKAA